MYAIVGFIIANDIFEGKIDQTQPVGSMTFINTFSRLEDAEIQKKNLESINEKSTIKFNYYILRDRAILLLYLNDDGLKESEKIEDPKPSPENDENPVKIPTESERLTESFSTLLHSLGVKKYSSNLLDQAEVSISSRRKEIKDILCQNKGKLSELRKYYSDTNGGDPKILERILSHIDDVDEDGVPKCLSDSYIY